MNFDPGELDTYALKYGDILLNEGQSPELVGRPAIYRDEVPGACFQNTLIRFRGCPRVDADFVLLVFRHYMHAGIFRGIARWSTNIAHLGLERFRALQFPVPPLEEQKRIVKEAQRHLIQSAEVKTATQASLGRLPEIERELLAAAVAGELAPQDAGEEAASALVKRLGAPPREAILDPLTEETDGETTMPKGEPLSPRTALTGDLASVLRSAGRPLLLPELFGRAGYDRNQPEHVELFYLAIRSQLGQTIRQTGDLLENALLEPNDAA
jgi:type I restriction enzyme S subunit